MRDGSKRRRKLLKRVKTARSRGRPLSHTRGMHHAPFLTLRYTWQMTSIYSNVPEHRNLHNTASLFANSYPAWDNERRSLPHRLIAVSVPRPYLLQAFSRVARRFLYNTARPYNCWSAFCKTVCIGVVKVTWIVCRDAIGINTFQWGTARHPFSISQKHSVASVDTVNLLQASGTTRPTCYLIATNKMSACKPCCYFC